MYHQPDAYHTPYTNHYPNQYPTSAPAIPAPISYFPPFQALQQPVKVEYVPPEPPEPAVTPKVASRAIESLVLLELQNAGYERAERHAVQRLELEVSTCAFLEHFHGVILVFSSLIVVVQQLFQRAHEYANLANRARAIASDVLMAWEDFDLAPNELNRVKKIATRQQKGCCFV